MFGSKKVRKEIAACDSVAEKNRLIKEFTKFYHDFTFALLATEGPISRETRAAVNEYEDSMRSRLTRMSIADYQKAMLGGSRCGRGRPQIVSRRAEEKLCRVLEQYAA